MLPPVRVLFLLAFALLCGCASQPSIETTQAADVDWASFRTYSWLERPGPEEPGPTIRTVVEERLAARGYRRVDSLGDFRVAVRGEIRGTQYTSGVVWDWDGPHQAQSGVLDMAVLDGRSPRLLWSATARRKWPSELELEEIHAMIAEILNEFLDRFPPG